MYEDISYLILIKQTDNPSKSLSWVIGEIKKLQDYKKFTDTSVYPYTYSMLIRTTGRQCSPSTLQYQAGNGKKRRKQQLKKAVAYIKDHPPKKEALEAEADALLPFHKIKTSKKEKKADLVNRLKLLKSIILFNPYLDYLILIKQTDNPPKSLIWVTNELRKIPDYKKFSAVAVYAHTYSMLIRTTGRQCRFGTLAFKNSGGKNPRKKFLSKAVAYIRDHPQKKEAIKAEADALLSFHKMDVSDIKKRNDLKRRLEKLGKIILEKRG